MEIQEAIKSIRANLYDRTTSPLSGSFITAWCVWNYQTILAVFSDMDLDQKLNYINTSIYSDTHSFWIFGIVAPLFSSLLYIYAYPYPAKWTYQFQRNRQKDLKRIKIQIEDETPVDQQEFRSFRVMHELAVDAYEEKLQKLEQRIEDLKKHSGLIDTEADDLSSINLSLNELGLLELVANSSNGVEKSKLEETKVPSENGSLERPVKVKYYINNLTKYGLIQESIMEGSQRIGYTATTKGMDYVVLKGSESESY